MKLSKNYNNYIRNIEVIHKMNYERIGSDKNKSLGKNKTLDHVRRRDMERIARLNAKRKKKKRARLIALLVIVALILAFIGGCVYYIMFIFKNPVEEGATELNNGQYELALEHFAEGLDDIEYIAQSYKGMGMAYYELANYKDAIDSFNQAVLKGEGNTSYIYNLLSICYMNTGDYDSALENILIGIDKPGSSNELMQQMLLNEIVCLEKLNDWEGAKAKATQYLQSYAGDTNMQDELLFLETR